MSKRRTEYLARLQNQSINLPAESAPAINAAFLNRLPLILAAAFFITLWLVLCRHLSAEWRYNEQYSYGWFVPLFTLYIFWSRWEGRPKAESRNLVLASVAAVALLLLLLLLPIRLFEIANPGWRPLDWSHTIVVATLTLLAIWITGGKPWLRQFTFPIAFFFVALPWFSPIEEPIVQGLMRGVAAIVSEMMNLLGVPAHFEGSVIRVNTGLVGVSEACSGVRSLQTSLMIGLLFGELNRLTNARRLLLVVATIEIALVANAGRTFLLVWLAATRGLPSMERSHDMAGYAVLLIVFVGAVGLAAGLRRKGEITMADVEAKATEPRHPNPPVTSQEQSRILFLLSNSYFLICALCWLLLVEFGAHAWYRWHERGLVPQAQWSVNWPESARGFREIHLDDHTRRMLRSDQARGAMWNSDSSPPESNLLYFFRWKPGHNSALLAALHRPDVCLPATGWKQTADKGVRYYHITNNLAVPFRHFEFLHQTPGGQTQIAHAFYCLWEDRVRRIGNSTSEDEEMTRGPAEWSRAERVRLVVEGRRHLGQQVMEFVMASPQAVTAEDAEAYFTEKVRELIVATR